MFDNVNEDTIVWMMCKCYVHPTYARELTAPLDKQGRCGRCGEQCGLLIPDDYKTREQAEACFEQNYGHKPLPIGKKENGYWPEGIDNAPS